MLRVYLFRGKHPLYETMVTHPPEGVEYLPRRKGEAIEGYALYGSSHSFLRFNVNKFYGAVDLPRTIPILRKYDLVHSCRGFFVWGPNNSVIDLEHISSFVGMQHWKINSNRTRRQIEKGLLSSRCRHILPHCEMARRTISLVTKRREIDEKTTVIYPAVRPKVEAPRRNESQTPNLLFYGEYFWKGGREFLEACSRLGSKLDFRVTYISLRVHPPAKVIEEVAGKIDLHYTEGPVSRIRLLEEFYPSADVFVMPTSIDTFGYAFLEAMSFGIPCIGSSHFAVPEIIENDVNGYVVTPSLSCFDENGKRKEVLSIEGADSERTVQDLCARLDSLISSPGLRHRMGMNSLDSVRDGKFSVRRRNELLKEVYEACVRR